jgi:hypothetical protein
MSAPAWILYALGFMSVLTSAPNDPRFGQRGAPLALLMALIWPLAALLTIIINLRKIGHG